MVCFGFFHSLTARPGIRAAILDRWPVSKLVYAVIRSSISLSMLVLSLVILFQDAPGTPGFFQPILGLPAIIPTMFAIWVAGMALGQVAKSRRLPQVFGVKDDPKVFFFSAAYSICRHPMYAGWLLASWGMFLSKPYLLTLVYNALISVYVVYESLQEEKQMISLFGEKYRQYQKRVPFILPYGFLKKP